MVIYADILFTLNWWLDFLLLLGVRRALGVGARPWRLALGALVGALSAAVLFLPMLPWWLSLAVKLVAAGAMVAIAFIWQGWRAFGRQVLLLFGLSAGLAGLCGGLYFFAAPTDFYVFNGVVYYDLPPLLLVALTVVCYGGLCVVESLMRRRAPAGRCFTLRLSYGDSTVSVRCLYDSGNHLTEPFSNRPVLVVERAVAACLLPVPASPEELPPPDRAGWRLIPFDSLGGQGLLPAFVPDQVVAVTAGGERTLSPCYVAVCPRLGRGEYQGLLGSALGEELT